MCNITGRNHVFKTIVLGLDGSEESRQAAEVASDLVGRGCEIVAVHVRELLAGRAGGQTLYADEESIEADVRLLVDQLARDLNIRLKVVTSVTGGPAHILADIAGAVRADAIVVGTRGYTPMAGLLVGSVTQRLLHIAPCPVLAVPASTVEAATARSTEAAAVAG